MGLKIVEFADGHASTPCSISSRETTDKTEHQCDWGVTGDRNHHPLYFCTRMSYVGGNIERRKTTMKSLRWLAVIMLTVLAIPATFAQVSLKVGIGGGYVMPMGDYKGTAAEYYAGTNYGLSNGFDVHAKARVGLLGFNLTGQVGYSFLSNSGSPEGGNSSADISSKILSIELGPEFHLGLPAVPITPYLGANIAFNTFSGSTKFQGTTAVPSSTVDVASSSRFGIGATVGVIISSFDIAVHYNLYNLSGKKWVGADNRVDTYSSLNDDKDPAYAPADTKHVVKDPRSLQSLVLSVSYMFGF